MFITEKSTFSVIEIHCDKNFIEGCESITNIFNIDCHFHGDTCKRDFFYIQLTGIHVVYKLVKFKMKSRNYKK